jgi:energy-coupling factor transporter ATP-binding protein EcfA2
MPVYNEIIEWSYNKPEFMRDGLRRLLINPSLSSIDIDELTLILKKEVGFTGIVINAVPVTLTDIPVHVNQVTQNTKLTIIEKPVNINALYHKAKLEFSKDGLTIVYGNNGSGKSSYARILKKLCWSRHKNVELKKNVYTKDLSSQAVTIAFDNGGTNTTFNWAQGQATHQLLNSIFVFDTNCANIYLNNENNTEYKPLGIDLLESLIAVCNKVDSILNSEMQLLNSIKPTLDGIKYSATNLLQWYNKVETIQIADINLKLSHSQINEDRKNELIQLLKSANPLEENKIISQKIQRFETVKNSIRLIETAFSEQNILSLKQFKGNLIDTQDAYKLAQQSLKVNNPLAGVGSETWRLMWEAAKNFAITEIHPHSHNFPDAQSIETCVLCQQSLNPDAITRLNRFNEFVLDKTNSSFQNARKQLSDKILEFSNLEINITDTFSELKLDISSFESTLGEFELEFGRIKKQLLEYGQLENNIELSINSTLVPLSNLIQLEINRLNNAILQNGQLATARIKFEKELLEIEALEFLTTQKVAIVKYVTEYSTKHWLNQCKSKINIAMISRKIGEIMESQAIQLQQIEFFKHLNYLDKGIASKVAIKKTRTTGGTTHQKCDFIGIDEPLNNILSDVEQKIIALSNFLSECTIDNATNSIVFDDPVTSLDQDFREAIANIIVELSKNRQIIVLTHDLFFLRLLMDTHKVNVSSDCAIIGLTKDKEVSGFSSDEIPYLVKNTQERIDNIKKILVQVNSLQPSEQLVIEALLDGARKRVRMLIEKSVEELLANKSIERFSKKINVKSGNLSSFVVVEHSDIQLLLTLFGKYSITEHDGSSSTLPQLPDKAEIDSDLRDFGNWKNDFNARLKAFKTINGY